MPPAVLDSSPLRADSSRDAHEDAKAHKPARSLKRSASTASLLTPPQTIVRKGRYARSRSRGSGHASDDDGEVSDYGQSVSDTRRRLDFGRKRRRTERLDAVLAALDGEDPENPFWEGASVLGEEDTSHREEGRKNKSLTRSSSPPLEADSSHGQAPFSPPPSRRRTSTHTRSRSEAAPSTPKSKGKARGGYSDTELMEDDPLRDSPNNPFLDDSPMSITAEPIEPRTPTEHSEKPTLQYVFRGVKATFANPLYNLPPEVHERSLLPVNHPDYSPDPACPPKLLFAEARRKKGPSSPTRVRARTSPRTPVRRKGLQTGAGWDSEEDELHITPPRRLLFRES